MSDPDSRPESLEGAFTPESGATEPGPEAPIAEPPSRPEPLNPSAPQPLSPSSAPSYVLLIGVTVVSVALDLASKWWAKHALSGMDSRRAGAKHLEVIKDHVDFIFAQNPGGAWSFLRGLPEYVRRPFFLFISAAAIVFIVSIYRRVRPEQVAMKWGLPLALGGAIGNLVDRIRYGYVIDFIDVYVTRGQSEHHWPTFNVADIWICVGVALMAFDMFAASRRARAQELALRAAETVPGEPPA